MISIGTMSEDNMDAQFWYPVLSFALATAMVMASVTDCPIMGTTVNFCDEINASIDL
jgi:hypothetical protein